MSEFISSAPRKTAELKGRFKDVSFNLGDFAQNIGKVLKGNERPQEACEVAKRIPVQIKHIGLIVHMWTTDSPQLHPHLSIDLSTDDGRDLLYRKMDFKEDPAGFPHAAAPLFGTINAEHLPVS